MISARRVWKVRLQMNYKMIFELFMFKAIRQVYGSRVHYQSGNNYLVHSVDSGRNYIRLRPDIAIYSDSGNYIIDTKWKMPISFAKESDIYQMNAYSTGIGKVERVFLLYPKTSGIRAASRTVIALFKYGCVNFPDDGVSKRVVIVTEISSASIRHQVPL